MLSYRHTSLHTFLTIITTLMLSLVVFKSSAYAAVVPGTQFKSAKTQTHRASLQDISGYTDEVLDWRRTETEINFSIPAGEWATAITLDLHALPQGNIDSSTPLTVSLNGGKAVPIESRGQQFEANISFPTTKLRKVNNRLTIRFNTPAGQDCLSSAHGAWVVDFSRSIITMKTRNESRDFRLSEVEKRLKDPFVAPNRVSLVARGEQKLAFEALAAQGIGLRMNNIPRFSTNGAGDINVLIGTRSALKSKIRDAAIMKSSGAQIAVMDNRPLTLVITGDTEGQVLESVKAFARYHLPAVRREMTTPEELEMQDAFAQDGVQARGKAKLYDLGATGFDMSYRPKPATLSFQVDDPKTASAELVLDLSRNKIAGPNSRVDVTLNGRALGYAVMTRTKKRVSFPVPVGSFRASANELVITPTLEAKSEDCIEFNYEPAIILGHKSYLKMTKAKTDTASLSRLSGSASPFSTDYASNTSVILTAKSQADRAVSFAVLARLAKSSGYGWSEAQFAHALPAAEMQRNIVFIGAMGSDKSALMSTAPRSFIDAANGIAARSASTGLTQTIVASNSDTAFQLAANRTAPQGSKFNARGLAAIYSSPLSSSAVIGVITTTGRSDFARSVNPITSDAHWDSLQGGVARWNKKTLVMTQASNPSLNIYAPKPQAPATIKGRFASLGENLGGFTSGLKDKFSRKPKPQTPAPNTAPSGEPLIAKAPQSPAALKPARLRAKPQDVAALSPQIAPVLTAPALRGRSNPAAMTAPLISASDSSSSSILSIFDMSDFDYGLFKTNLSKKLTSARRGTVRLIGGHMSAQEIRASWTSIKADKSLWLTIMGLFVILGLLFISPKSANRHY